jgi:hypothetical protein
MLNKEEASLWRKMIAKTEKLLKEMHFKPILDAMRKQEKTPKNKYFEHLFSPRFF